jgi:hypothetical protein
MSRTEGTEFAEKGMDALFFVVFLRATFTLIKQII